MRNTKISVTIPVSLTLTTDWNHSVDFDVELNKTINSLRHNLNSALNVRPSEIHTTSIDAVVGDYIITAIEPNDE